jgi:hypothetical protein
VRYTSSSMASHASGSSSSFLPLIPRLSARSPFPHGLAREGIRPNPVQRVLLFARLQEVGESVGAKSWVNEQLPGPPLLNLAAKNDVDFRFGQ